VGKSFLTLLGLRDPMRVTFASPAIVSLQDYFPKQKILKQSTLRAVHGYKETLHIVLIIFPCIYTVNK
jgi:hypothetical protein